VASRTCPHCGFTDESTQERCSACGRSVFVRAPRLTGRRRRQAQWGAALAVLAVAAAAILVALSLQADRKERERAQAARAVTAEKVRLRKLQAPHRGSATDLRPPAGAGAPVRLAARAALVRRVEARITADARARASTGEIKGPIRGSECSPFLKAPDAIPDDRELSKGIGRYDCAAIKADIRKADNATVGRLGYAFVAALDFDRFTYVWCRNTPAQSESGEPLAVVRLDRACLAATGRPVGNGYADVPGS
jgi:hypothetical protein